MRDSVGLSAMGGDCVCVCVFDVFVYEREMYVFMYVSMFASMYVSMY